MNLEKGIAKGTFREDLYYRLNRMPIHIPRLKEEKRKSLYYAIGLFKKLIVIMDGMLKE